MKNVLVTLVMMLGTISVGAQAEPLAVIVSKDNPINELSVKDVKRIFLGKMKRFPSGGKIKMTDYKKGKSLRKTFYKKVTNKSVKDVDTYWYRLVFTGKGVPPKPFSDAEDVIEYISEHPNAIGYIKLSELKAGVKKVLLVR